VTPVDPRSWAASRPTGVARFLPIVRWLPAYDRGLLRFDVIAGATIWGLLVPEMIAYAGLAGLLPQAGLYTLLVSLVAYAVFGSSRQLVAAGTSASAVVLASGVAALSPSSAEDYATLGAGMVLICGAIFLIAGIARLGFIARFLSRPVMDGFIFGLAIFVTVSQLPKILGIEKAGGDTVQQLWHIVGHLGDTSGVTLAVGVAALVLLFGCERYAPRIPGGLVALLGGIIVSAAFDLHSHGVEIVGTVPSGLPSVGVPHIPASDAYSLIGAAAGMGLVIFSESLGAAENFAQRHGYEIDADQEMIALGVVNVGSGLVGGLAAGGSLSQTAVNDGAGARSELSPIVASVLALITILVLTPLFTDLPEAVLAALIIHAVSHLWKIAAFRRYYSERRFEFWLGLITLAGVVVLDVLPGLVIGVVAMLLVLVYHASRAHLSVLGAAPPALGGYGSVERHPDYTTTPGVLVVRLEAPLMYVNASLVRDGIKRLVGEANPLPDTVILDMSPNPALDITAAETLTELAENLSDAGIRLVLAEVRERVDAMLERSGTAAALGDGAVVNTIDDALRSRRVDR
jgi:sulfate permease, SulP family